MNHAEFRHILTLELSAQKQHNSEYFGSNGKNGLFRSKGGAQVSPEELFSTKLRRRSSEASHSSLNLK